MRGAARFGAARFHEARFGAADFGLPGTRYHHDMPDLVIVLVIVLILVLLWRGPKTLPRLGEALGRGVREARTAARTDDDDPPRPSAEDDRRV